jgi:branched-chain amino acid transport system substrate-binding protein
MKKVKGFRLGIGMVLFLFLVPLLLGAPTVQAEEKWVTYFANSDYTGPIAALVMPMDMGEEDYFKYINEQGGINGVKIKFIGVDTRYDTARMISAYKRYRKTPKLLATTTWSTGTTKILSPYVTRDKLIQITPADGEFQAHPGRTFLFAPTYQDSYAGIIDWIISDWRSKGKSGMPTVGEMSWDNPYGRERLRGGKEYAEKMGVKLLEPEYFRPGTLKHDVYLKRMANAGADYIHLGGVDPTQTNIIRDAYRLGLTKKIQFSSGYWGISIGGVKSHPEPLEGAVVISPFLRGEDALNHPLVQKLWTKYKGPMSTFKNGGYCMGIAMGINFCSALKVALEEVGYDKITGDDMYRAYQKIGGKETEGLTGPCTYGPKSRRGSNLAKIYRVKDSKIVPITDWVRLPDAVSLHKW